MDKTNARKHAENGGLVGPVGRKISRVESNGDILNDERWHLEKGDCIEHMATLPDACFDFSVFSPPFPALYSYTELGSDIGNSEDFSGEAQIHLSYFYHQLARTIKPGRVVVVHVMQIPKLKRAEGRGLHDFRGMNIRLGQRAGLIYEYDWMVTKNPQAQAIRTHSHELQFAGLERDQARCRGAVADYLIKFTAEGDNAVPVKNNISRNDWINWAESVWTWHDIKTTDTLNTRNAKGEKDTKHICPLQLGVIDRLVKLYTNPDEVVFSPFAGIGSEGYISLKLGRRFYGCELKDEYFDEACKNLANAQRHEAETMALFQM